MSAFGVELGLLALRVTFVALVALAMVAAARRCAARGLVIILAGVMAILLGMSVAAWCPLPDDWGWTLTTQAAASGSEESAAVPDTRSATAESAPAGATLNDLLARLARWRGSAPETPAWRSGWTAIAWISLIGLGVAVARLVVGWRALIALRRGSREIVDPDLLALAAQVRCAIGCTAVQIRESHEPGLAATLGWRRPVVLLPPEWRAWPENERRAVLAHEFAHVRHRDFLSGIIAGVCRAVHFYHPLIGWLAGQLRRRQEVAADDVAARAAGGRTVYLRALARLALRLPARTPAGASSILPAMTGGALLWRIHMLHRSEQRPLHPGLRGLLIAGLAAIAVLVTGWRGQAESEGDTPPPQETTPFELGYLMPGAKGLCAVRPSLWMKQPGMDAVARKVDELIADARKAGANVPDTIRPENIEQIVADLQLTTAGDGKPGSRQVVFATTSVFVRFHKEVDAPALLRLVAKDVKEVRKGETVGHYLGTIPELGPAPITMFMPDRRSIVLVGHKDPETAMTLIESAAAARKRDWGSGWKNVARAPFAAVLDNSDGNYGEHFAVDLKTLGLKPDTALRSIVDNIRFATLGIELGDGRPVRLMLDAKSPDAAKGLEQVISQFMVKGLPVLKQALDANHPGPGEQLGWKLASELVETRQVSIDGSRVEWLGFSTVRVRHVLELEGLVNTPREDRP